MSVTRVNLLLEFMKICSQGLVRPYDPVIMAIKIADAKRNNPGLDFTSIETCCPNSPEVRDVGDLKPYILAAAKDIAYELELKVEDRQTSWKNR